MKFDVTFKFDNCSVTVMIEADTWIQAIAKARSQHYPPVPYDIPATADYSGPGGRRAGAGVKHGSIRTSEPRNVKKQIGHTKNEWQFIEQECEKSGLDIQTYQREILALGIITKKDRRYRQ